MEEWIRTLQTISLFRGLGGDHLERVAAIAEILELGEGQTIFREGEKGDSLYAILKGRVRISRQIPGIGEEALAILEPGDYFGEVALIDDDPRSADAITHEPCKLLTIRKAALQNLMFNDLAFAHEVLWNIVRTLASRLRESNDKMTFLAVNSRFT